jgi:hypothetical protein
MTEPCQSHMAVGSAGAHSKSGRIEAPAMDGAW